MTRLLKAAVATALGLGLVLTGAVAAQATDKEPDVGYGLALWSADHDGGDTLWPQTLVAYVPQPIPDLNGLDHLATECGTTYQADLYRDDATTATLVAGGVLLGPGNPTESWPGDKGYQSSFSKVWTTEPCVVVEPPVVEPPVVEPPVVEPPVVEPPVVLTELPQELAYTGERQAPEWSAFLLPAILLALGVTALVTSRRKSRHRA